MSGDKGYGDGVMSCVFELRTERMLPMTQRDSDIEKQDASPSNLDAARTPSADGGGAGGGNGEEGE
jgi:hypothetical protein